MTKRGEEGRGGGLADDQETIVGIVNITRKTAQFQPGCLETIHSLIDLLMERRAIFELIFIPGREKGIFSLLDFYQEFWNIFHIENFRRYRTFKACSWFDDDKLNEILVVLEKKLNLLSYIETIFIRKTFDY